MRWNGKNVLWDHIKTLFEMEQSKPALTETKLTAAAMKLTSHSKVSIFNPITTAEVKDSGVTYVYTQL